MYEFWAATKGESAEDPTCWTFGFRHRDPGALLVLWPLNMCGTSHELWSFPRCRPESVGRRREKPSLLKGIPNVLSPADGTLRRAVAPAMPRRRGQGALSGGRCAQWPGAPASRTQVSQMAYSFAPPRIGHSSAGFMSPVLIVSRVRELTPRPPGQNPKLWPRFAPNLPTQNLRVALAD